MESFNKYRSPIVLGVLIMFLVLFAFFMLGVQPTNKEIASQNDEIERLEKETNIFQNKINELKGAGDSVDPEQQELLAALPKGDDSEGLIYNFSAVGMSSYARLNDVSFTLNEVSPIQGMAGSSEMLYPTVKQIKMSAVVEGTYTNIRAWMTELQALPRIVNIDSFNFQPSYVQGTEGMKEDILTASVSFTAYYEAVTQRQTTEP